MVRNASHAGQAGQAQGRPHTAPSQLRDFEPQPSRADRWLQSWRDGREGLGQGAGPWVSPLPEVARTDRPHLAARPGPAQPVPAELALEDLCAEEAESQELEAMWTGLLVFTTLFLLSVSYGAAITLCKVGTQTALLPGGAPRDRESPLPGRRALTSTLPQVKWVLAAILQEQPPASHDYTNVQEPAA